MTPDRWKQLHERTWFREEQDEVAAYVEELLAQLHDARDCLELQLRENSRLRVDNDMNIRLLSQQRQLIEELRAALRAAGGGDA